MPYQDQLDMKGRLTLKLQTLDGAIVEEKTIDNMIVNPGRRLVANLFSGQGGAKPIRSIAVGTNDTPTSPGQTNLFGTVISKTISKIVVQEPNNDRVNVQVSIDLGANEPTIPAGQTAVELKEAGIFNEDGIMYNRVTFPVVSKTADFKLTLVWEIIF